MQKIISLFQRNYDTDRLVRDEVVPGAEWVLAGEGIATRKYDGVCTMIRGGVLFRRYELKPGKNAPSNWEAVDEKDAVTGKQMGWVPCNADDPNDRFMLEAMETTRETYRQIGHELLDGTYEFVGPKSQGNIEGFTKNLLTPHGGYDLMVVGEDPPRDFEGLKAYFVGRDIEGVVWHHPDGRMVKIKGKDFDKKHRRP